MANEQNLIYSTDPDGHKLTVEEQKMGGIASGKARRQYSTLKKALEYIGSQKPSSEKIKQAMTQAGIPEEEQTNEMAGALRIVLGFVSGDHKSVSEYMKGTGQEITRSINENHNVEYKPLVDLTKRKKNGAKDNEKN